MNLFINGYNVFLIILVTFIASVALTPVVKKIAVHVNAVDKPDNKRKVHYKIMPSMGGLAIFLAFLLGYMLFAPKTTQMLSILIGGFVIVLMGILDDIKPLPVKYKLIGQVIASCIAVFYGNIIFDDMTIFRHTFEFGIFAYPLSVLFIVVALVSVFSLSASAADLSLGVLVDDVYYFTYENIALVTGFDMDENDVSPKPGIVIPEEITYRGNEYKVMGVADQAFYMCDYTSVTLPSTIVYMGNGAFMSSPYLEKVVIPDSCEFMAFGDDVFIGTPFEAEIYSKDETIFGKNVLFSYTGNAEEYTIPDNIEIIVSKCFFMSGLKNVVFNNKVTVIPDYAFMSCRNLTDVTISKFLFIVYLLIVKRRKVPPSSF